MILNIGWDQAEHGMAGDSGELFAAVKGARHGVHAQPGPVAGAGSARQLPRARLDSHRLGRAGLATTGKSGPCGESLLGRWGTPEDVARAVRFLASPAAAFITGQVIPVNGGLRQL